MDNTKKHIEDFKSQSFSYPNLIDTDREKFQFVQSALFKISEATSISKDLKELLSTIHQILSTLVDTTNFYVALYDDKLELYTFPYSIDEYDGTDFAPEDLKKSLTDYVRRIGKSILVDEAAHEELNSKENLDLIGVPSKIWLGVPLKTPDGNIGVVVVQSYHNSNLYTTSDLALLEFVSDHVAIAITRKRAEDELRESEIRLRHLAEATHEGIGMSEDGIVIEVNEQLAEMLGYSSRELIGTPIKNFVAPESFEKVAHHVSRNSQDAYEHLALKKDGTKIFVEARGRSTRYKGKQVRVTAIRDISETKRLQELESRAARLETAGTIAGQVAHDFNNLLGPLMAYPEIIREELPEDHPTLHYLNQIEQAAIKISEINHQLLTLGRRGHYNQDVVNLNSTIQQVVNDMVHQDEHLTYKLHLAPELMNIHGGCSQLYRVFNNLFRNAADSMQESGEIVIKSENYYADNTSSSYGLIPKGEYVKVTISDTGCGISDDILQKILDPFFTTKTSDKCRGSGLGLSVVNAVVNDHKGFLDLQTKLDEGTSFYLYFPITRMNPEDDKSDEVNGNGETILVVDDDDVQREVSSKLLERLGYIVSSIDCGEKAIEFLREHSMDLILLDMVMPEGIDGAETYKRIQEIYPNQKAIIVSGYSESKRVRFAQSLGAGAFIKKPLTKKIIADAVRAEFDRREKIQN